MLLQCGMTFKQDLLLSFQEDLLKLCFSAVGQWSLFRLWIHKESTLCAAKLNRRYSYKEYLTRTYVYVSLKLQNFRRFGSLVDSAWRRDAVLRARAFLLRIVFTLVVATRRMASEGRVRAGWDREHGQKRTRQKEGRSEKEEHLTLCLAACRTQLILDAAPANPRRAACVNKRIERVCW